MKYYSSLLTAVAVALGAVASAHAVLVTGLTSANTLVTFDSTSPGTITGTSVITGLIAGDLLVGIDYRPIDGQLVGVGYNTLTGNANVYSLTSAGAATNINATFSLGTGVRVTADFNPFANALRVVTSAATGNNKRIPTGGAGAVTGDADLNPANVGIRATAYSRNSPGGGTSGATTLYEVDGTNLLTQGTVDFFGAAPGGNSPNNGTLSTVASLSGVTGTSIVGFDIYNAPGTAATSPGNAFLATGNTFYSLNLGTAAATMIGGIGGGLTLTDFAVVPEPSSLALCGIAAAGVAAIFRKRRSA